MESIEYLGFIATIFVLLSFLMNGDRLRWVNSIGAALWFAYGFILGSYSIMFLNLCVVVIHMIMLWKNAKKKITQPSKETNK